MNPISQFILTFVIELIVFLVFFRKKPLQTLAYCFLINLFSWPIANLVYDIYNNLLFIEIGVVFLESVLIMLLFKANYLKSLLIAFLANAVSFFAGLLFII